MSNRRKKQYPEESIANLAAKGFSKIQDLSKSSLISEKLSAINMILYLIVLSIGITFYLDTSRTNMFVFIIIFALSLLFASISLLFYAPFLEIVVNICKNKVEGLRVSISVLFIDLTIAITALLFNIEILIKIALGFLGVQIIALLIFSYINIPQLKIQDKKTEPFNLWDSLGKISTILGIITFIIDIIIIIISV